MFRYVFIYVLLERLSPEKLYALNLALLHVRVDGGEDEGCHQGIREHAWYLSASQVLAWNPQCQKDVISPHYFMSLLKG